MQNDRTGGMAMVFIDITKVRSTSLGRLRCPARIKTFIQSWWESTLVALVGVFLFPLLLPLACIPAFCTAAENPLNRLSTITSPTRKRTQKLGPITLLFSCGCPAIIHRMQSSVYYKLAQNPDCFHTCHARLFPPCTTY